MQSLPAYRRACTSSSSIRAIHLRTRMFMSLDWGRRPRSSSCRTMAAIPAGLRVRLRDRGCLLVALPSTVVAQGIGALGLALPLEEVLEPVQRALWARAKKAAGPPRVSLPAGIGWPQVTLTLVEAQTLAIACDGTTHRLDPGELGMRRSTNNRPTSALDFPGAPDRVRRLSADRGCHKGEEAEARGRPPSSFGVVASKATLCPGIRTDRGTPQPSSAGTRVGARRARKPVKNHRR